MLAPRRSTHRYSVMVAVVVLVSSVVAGAAVASHREEADGESDHARVECPADHSERGDLDHHRAPHPTVRGLLVQQVGVGLRSATVLHLDTFGRVVDAATNTGCAPRQTDDIYVKMNGSATLVTDVNISRVHWDGDFSKPGTYYRQTHVRLCLFSRGCV
jgi:hypothetical protein